MPDRNRTSKAIVAFIGALLPLYRAEYVGREVWARSQRDGTLIKPIDEPPDDEDGRVEVWWQGDQARSSVEKGVFIVELVLSDYVDFHCRGKPDRYRQEIVHLSDHFQRKTGVALGHSDDDPLLAFLEFASKALGKLGPAALLALLRKVTGL